MTPQADSGLSGTTQETPMTPKSPDPDLATRSALRQAPASSPAPALPAPSTQKQRTSPAAESRQLPVGLERLRPWIPDRTVLRYGVRPFLMLLDAGAIFLACRLFAPPARMTVAFIALNTVLLAAAGFYRSRLTLSLLDDLPMLLGRTLTSAAIVVCGGLLWRGSPGELDVAVLQAGVLGAGLVLAARLVGYRVVRHFRAKGWVAHPTLVLGAGRVGGMIGTMLIEHREYGLKPIGFLDDDPLLPEEERPVPVLGGPADLAKVVVEFGVRDVIVAFGSLAESEMVDIIRTCDRLEVEIFFVPRLFELQHGSRDVENVWGIPLFRLRRPAFQSPSWVLKRAMDVALSGLALLLLAPVLAACALAVRLEGGKGVLFRQERVGLDGRHFQVLKFRSIKPANDVESQTRWSVAPANIGIVGRTLRATSLDELPQLWNILRGDMTLVGPRPERPFFVDTFTQTFPRYTARHRVPSGLTGWAQVHGLRGDTSIEDRARFDNFYIEHWSLWADVKIMVRTVGQVLKRAGG